MQHCKERLTSAALPSRMHCVSKLPESSSGKLQRSRLKELLCEHRVDTPPSGAAVAVTSARPGMGTASGVAPADALGASGSLSEPEVLPAVAPVEPQSDSLTAEAAVAGLARPGLEPASEAGVMRAFQASLGAHARGLEPVTDFWAAGGDSRAAMQVPLDPTAPASFRLDTIMPELAKDNVCPGCARNAASIITPVSGQRPLCQFHLTVTCLSPEGVQCL